MQGRGVVKPPTGITFDSDFGNNIDSLLTLALLRAMASKGQCRVISVSITRSNLKAAQAEDAFSTFYQGGPPAAGGRNVALVKSFSATVGAGRLSITFTSHANNAEINGIEVLPNP